MLFTFGLFNNKAVVTSETDELKNNTKGNESTSKLEKLSRIYFLVCQRHKLYSVK
jgi:hypothetical protein